MKEDPRHGVAGRVPLRPSDVPTFEFDALRFTVAPETAVSGRVFASELATTREGETVDRPLAPTVIAVDDRGVTKGVPEGAYTIPSWGKRGSPSPVGRRVWERLACR